MKRFLLFVMAIAVCSSLLPAKVLADETEKAVEEKIDVFFNVLSFDDSTEIFGLKNLMEEGEISTDQVQINAGDTIYDALKALNKANPGMNLVWDPSRKAVKSMIGREFNTVSSMGSTNGLEYSIDWQWDFMVGDISPIAPMNECELGEDTEVTLIYMLVLTARDSESESRFPLGAYMEDDELVNVMPYALERSSLWRFLNKKSGDHVYTNDPEEAEGLKNNKKWVYEGPVGEIYTLTTHIADPVFRLYNPKTGAHHITADPDERYVLVHKHKWKDEGIIFFQGGKTPIYRLTNPLNGSHILTSDKNEKKILVKKYKWADEGIAFYLR